MNTPTPWSQATGPEIMQAIYDAYDAIVNPKPYDGPTCHCGSAIFIQNHGLAFPGQPNGMYCHNGHRLPGQDLPRKRTPLPGGDTVGRGNLGMFQMPESRYPSTSTHQLTFEYCSRCWQSKASHKNIGTDDEPVLVCTVEPLIPGDTA